MRRHSTNPWIVLVVICFAQFMVVLDATIVNVALYNIKSALHFGSDASLQWVVTSYTLFFAGFLLLGGRVGDLLGRKRFFLIGLVIFTTASFLDGISTSAGELVGFRALQGLGAALISPAALSIISTTFSEGKEARSRARCLGGDRDRRLRLRLGARRLADAGLLVVLDLLHQRPHWDPHAARRPAARPSEVEGRARAQGLRPRRRRHGHRRSHGARVRLGPFRAWLGLDVDDRPVHRRGAPADLVRSHRRRAPWNSLVRLSIFRVRVRY